MDSSHDIILYRKAGMNMPVCSCGREKRTMINLRRAIIALLLACAVMLQAGMALGESVPWDCPECGRTGNTGKFCGGCGHEAVYPEPEPDDSIPVLKELYPGTEVKVTKQVNALTGPAKTYGGAGRYKAEARTTVTAYYIIESWVFVRIGYNNKNMRYGYIPANTLENTQGIPVTDRMKCWEGKTTEAVIPYTEPDSAAAQKSEYKLAKDTDVKVLFQQDGFAYAEYYTKGKSFTGYICMWIPMKSLSLSENSTEFTVVAEKKTNKTPSKTPSATPAPAKKETPIRNGIIGSSEP